MIDPVIFRIPLLNWPVHWYGVILMTGFLAGAWMVERYLKRHGENGELIWDAAIWVLIPGVIGARLWYVLNATLGGDTRFSNNPGEIFRVWNGGLHIFGAFLFGAAALLLYLNRNKLDPWLFLDAIGPAALVGQAIGRLGNFINQELYGPPTNLPWGLKIFPENPYQVPGAVQGRSSQEILSYIETTRFHPTFAYEMLWNLAAAGLLLWLSRRYEKTLKPGTLFAGWLVLAGIGRTWIEFFRPDQPKIGDSNISYSMIIAALMAVAGAILLMARYKAIRIQAAENWEEEYKIATQSRPEEKPEEVAEEEIVSRARRNGSVKARASVGKKKPGEEASTPKKKTTTRTKKPTK
ncbi:MAG TPA: prolipoprotein diacylglyceryl transferase [Anaerolineales bacterium]|nr:prolipoprotein diacylglyceryl transferase [Anaerolineales bacterium]